MLAALHYNENSRREQATIAGDDKRYLGMFPKHEKGEHTVKQVKEPCTFGEWNRLHAKMTCTVIHRMSYHQGRIYNYSDLRECVASDAGSPKLETAQAQ